MQVIFFVFRRLLVNTRRSNCGRSCFETSVGQAPVLSRLSPWWGFVITISDRIEFWGRNYLEIGRGAQVVCDDTVCLNRKGGGEYHHLTLLIILHFCPILVPVQCRCSGFPAALSSVGFWMFLGLSARYVRAYTNLIIFCAKHKFLLPVTW